METLSAIDQLNKEAETFFSRTKKQFKSCQRAYVNADSNCIYSVWGDFAKREDAKKAIFVWGVAFAKAGGKVSSSVVDGNYRISVDF